MTDEIDFYGKFEVGLAERESFINGPLRKTWFEKYPTLFDELDYSQAIHQPNYHFYEWRAAILLYETTGNLSMLGKYQYPKHKRKREILSRLVDPQVFDLVINSKKLYHVQCPDLLVYTPDLSDYFFCEVKGCTDRIRKEQLILFDELKRVSSKRVCFLIFKPRKKSILLYDDL